MNKKQSSVLLGAILLLSSMPVLAASLHITDAWIKNLPPVVPMRAGYMTIKNSGEDRVDIVRVDSDVFSVIEIHETVEKDGRMSMQPLSTLRIEPGETRQMAPGGIHLMMMQPRETLKPGSQVLVILNFGDGGTQTLLMTVRK